MSWVDLILAMLVVVSILLTLGMMREAVLLRNQVVVLEQLVTKPLEPSYVGARIPRELASQLENARAEPDAVLFLTDGCGGCHAFADEVTKYVAANNESRSKFAAVVANDAMHQPLAADSALARKLEDAGLVVVRDTNRNLFAKSEVFAAPSALIVNPTDRTVRAFSSGGDFPWVLRALQQTAEDMTTH